MPSNIIGKQIQKLRVEQGMTQEQLSAKCQRVGFDVSRGTLAKIEAEVRGMSDAEVQMIAKALKISINELYPKSKRR